MHVNELQFQMEASEAITLAEQWVLEITEEIYGEAFIDEEFVSSFVEFLSKRFVIVPDEQKKE